MYYYSIAMYLIQDFFDENFTWQLNLNSEGSIMCIREFRIIVALYLMFLWCMVTIFILLLVKLM